MIVIGESVVAVAIETAGSQWRVDSAAAAVLGFIAVVAVWWLYFDRQEGVVLRGSAWSVVVYSYAHLPLLMGLAAMSAGMRLLIERAGQDQLGVGPSVALLGGVALFIASLVGTRTVTLGGPIRIGLTLKTCAVTLILGLIAAERALPPLAVAGGLAVVLVALVLAERTLVPTSRAS